MILLAFATEIEARPFIEYHHLKKKKDGNPYDLYEGSDISLIVTGMGSIKGAVYLSDLIQNKMKESIHIAKIINYGIAGCLSDKFSIGDVVEIDRVIKYNPVELSKTKPDKHFISAFPDITINKKNVDINILATSDHPVFNKDDSEIIARCAHFVDMEGYGYAFAAGCYNIPIQLIKWVSDFVFKHSEESFKQNVKTCLKKLLISHTSRNIPEKKK